MAKRRTQKQRVLALIESSTRPLGFREIAKRLKIPEPSVRRITQELRKRPEGGTPRIELVPGKGAAFGPYVPTLDDAINQLADQVGWSERGVRHSGEDEESDRVGWSRKPKEGGLVYRVAIDQIWTRGHDDYAGISYADAIRALETWSESENFKAAVSHRGGQVVIASIDPKEGEIGWAAAHAVTMDITVSQAIGEITGAAARYRDSTIIAITCQLF